MAHYYQPAEIQDIADYIGDSLALAQIAAKLDNARMIVLCGVHFMGETAKGAVPRQESTHSGYQRRLLAGRLLSGRQIRGVCGSSP